MIGKYFKHSKIAVKDGFSPYRIYAVVDIKKKNKSIFYIAWALILNEDGTIGHPAYNYYNDKLDLVKDHDKIFVKNVNDKFPSIIFKKDNYLYNLYDEKIHK